MIKFHKKFNSLDHFNKLTNLKKERFLTWRKANFSWTVAAVTDEAFLVESTLELWSFASANMVIIHF